MLYVQVCENVVECGRENLTVTLRSGNLATRILSAPDKKKVAWLEELYRTD